MKPIRDKHGRIMNGSELKELGTDDLNQSMSLAIEEIMKNIKVVARAVGTFGYTAEIVAKRFRRLAAELEGAFGECSPKTKAAIVIDDVDDEPYTIMRKGGTDEGNVDDNADPDA